MSDSERPERASQIAAERRRRDGSSLGHRLKLEVPEEVRTKLAAENRSPRWVNDTENRISDLTTRDDYDLVEGVEPKKVGTKEDGSPLFAYLLSKRNDFIAEDRQKSDKRRRDVEAARFKPGENQSVEGKMGAATYVDSASKIERRNQVLE
jgi:hypothetical protein